MKTIALVLLILAIISIFTVIYFSQGRYNALEGSGDFVVSHLEEYQFSDGDYTDFHLSVRLPHSLEENRDICYDLIYMPDQNFAENFVKNYYARPVWDENGTMSLVWGEQFKGKYGDAEFPKLFRTNGDDQVIVSFYNGTNYTFSLTKMPVVYRVIEISNTSFKALYDCYFDGVLRASNLTYDQLNSHVCDSWERVCQR